MGELSKVCSQIVQTCLYLARIGRHDILWSVNEFARSITKWTKACGNRLSRLTSYIHHTSEYKQILSGWAPILQEILRTRNLLRVEHCPFLEVIHLFQSVGCVGNKLQFRTVQQNHKSFLWMQDWGWMVSPRLIYGIWSLQFFTETRIRVMKNGETHAKENSWKDWWSRQCCFYSLKRQLFSSGSFVVYLWRQRSSDQDDHKGKKPDNETCFQNLQSCSWLVVC